MKRLNPETGKPFKAGDKREDGYVFQNYQLQKIKDNGYFQELWISSSTRKKRELTARKRHIKKKEFAKNNPGKRRLNQKTGKEFKLGDYVDGRYFLSYNNRYVRLDGYMPEIWGNWETFHRFKIKSLKVNAHYRAKKEGYKSDLTIDYLLDIFPKDFKCPALCIKMEWGNKKGTRTSPSLDKINPDKGYMKGNVAIISLKANSIKSDATPKEVIKVAKWLEEIS